ncbi:MAG: cyclic nucleotide-binding domain-containing protein [Acidobacteriota bacterium]
MSETAEQLDAMFPALTAAQIGRLSAFGQRRTVEPREIVFDLGDASRGVYVVLDGSIEVANVSKDHEDALRVLHAGEFTGEVNQISGRRSLVRCRAREASNLLEIPRSNLRRVIVGDIRAGSLKRVAAAVGDGSMAVQFVHKVLAG